MKPSLADRVATGLILCLLFTFAFLMLSYNIDNRSLSNVNSIDEKYYTVSTGNRLSAISLIIKSCNVTMNQITVVEGYSTIIFYCNNTEFINNMIKQDEAWKTFKHDYLYVCPIIDILIMIIFITADRWYVKIDKKDDKGGNIIAK